jgi:hypothetical protein
MKIFISHSAKTPVSSLLSLLKEEGATIRGSFELAPGQDMSESIRTEIHSADAVFVVLDSEPSNVTFELGIAFALRKPTLVLIRPGDSVTPICCLHALPDIYGFCHRHFEARSQGLFRNSSTS